MPDRALSAVHVVTSESMRGHYHLYFAVEETEAKDIPMVRSLRVTWAKAREVGRIGVGVAVKLKGPRKPPHTC